MLEKNLIKLIHSLEYKKYRKKNSLFVAEGPKVVGDLMRCIVPWRIFCTSGWHGPKDGGFDFVEISEAELTRISFLQSPQSVLGLFPLPQNFSIEDINPYEKLVIVLDGIQDPGNLGTIIRIADWFGIEFIVCSHETADAFCPKAVQATMGSLAKVKVLYADIDDMLERYVGKVPVYGTLLDGESIYTTQLAKHGFIIMGNEGKGISASVRKKITERLLIPSFSKGNTTDSLNVAIATAITCSEFMRRQ